MTETTDTPYGKLVHKAFIEPIRSVLIVDDQYPTLTDILRGDQKKAGVEKGWKNNPDKVLKVVNEFRKRNGPLLLDIHDGNIPTEEHDEREASQLQQTDLLILDYDLGDRPKNETGTTALRIARKALTNAHFNLIIVHTQENLDDVFSRFSLGLMLPLGDVGIELDADSKTRANDFLEDYAEAMREAFDSKQYLDLRKEFLKEDQAEEALKNLKRKILGPKSVRPWVKFSNLLKGSGEVIKMGDCVSLINAALIDFEEDQKRFFASREMSIRDWSGEGIRWIRCARGFIAFKSKDDKKDFTPLLPALHKALLAWRPHQSRLVLTKLRAEMNKRGFERQDDALGNKLIGAGWYHALLAENKKSAESATKGEVEAMARNMARNHAEQLLDQILPKVVEYTRELIKADEEKSPETAVKKTFQVDMRDQSICADAKIYNNAFVGSKPVESHHLELGHIFRIKDQYWLCMTPACDMIPGRYRYKSLHPDHASGLKRFSALYLRPTNIGISHVDIAKREKIIEETSGGNIVYANINRGNEIISTVFRVIEKPNESPVWMTMYAADDGILDLKRFDVQYARKDGRTNPPGLKMYGTKAEICGQLRYEYALHVQSILARSISRIGLKYLEGAIEQEIEQEDED